MPDKYAYNNEQMRHSDDVQDIITAVPSWLLRWGISSFFGVLVLIIGIAALIRYPDVVKTQLKINSSDLPTPVTANTAGRLVKLLVTQNEKVIAGQPLAYIENAADHGKKYVLMAPRQGIVSFAGIIHENQLFDINQQVLYIIPENEQFFGEMIIPQDNVGKIRAGQQVLIKLKAYPYEEYGVIKGKIEYITDVSFKNVFIARVDFQINNLHGLNQSVRLEPGMMADAEIITQDATILKRIGKSFKIL